MQIIQMNRTSVASITAAWPLGNASRPWIICRAEKRPSPPWPCCLQSTGNLGSRPKAEVLVIKTGLFRYVNKSDFVIMSLLCIGRLHHSFCPAPFFILDEVDAALDNSNIGKVKLQTGVSDFIRLCLLTSWS